MSDDQERTEEVNDNNTSDDKNDTEVEKSEEIKSDDANDKSDEPGGAKYIKLKVVGNSDSTGIHFKLKMTTPLLKLKKAYSTHKDIPVSGLRFLFDGKRINDEDTPMKLDMRDDDQIEVYHEQTGGVCVYP